MKKGFIYKLLYGEDKQQEYSHLNLPSTRTKQFFHVYKTNLGKLTNINMLTALFALPLIIWHMMSSIYVGEFMQSLSADEQFSYLLNLTLFQFGTEIPLIMLLFVGLSGAYYVIRKICWKAPVRLLKDFGKGIKSSYKQFLALGFCVGLVNLFANYFAEFSLYTMSEMPFGSVFTIASVILLSIILLAVFAFAVCQSSLYNLTFGKLMGNSFAFTFKKLFSSCGVAILSLLPVIVFQALPWVFMHVIGNCLTIVFSISFAVVMQTVYCHGVFDKYINIKQYPDFVGMGLSTGKNYFQATSAADGESSQPSQEGNNED